VLINLEEAGDLGTRRDDVLLLGKCDDMIKDLATELGWLKELKELWAETRTTLDNPPPKDETEEEAEDQVPEAEETEEEKLKREIAWITKSVGDTLKITDDLKKRVEEEAEEEEKGVKASPVGAADAGKSQLQKDGPSL